MKNDGAQGVSEAGGSGAGSSGAGSSGGTKGSVLVQSVDRAVAILEILASRGEVGVSDLAGELGVHKSTAFRLVNVLCARGLVEQPGERGKYRLGFGIVRLAGATAARLDLNRQSRPVSERLAAVVEELRDQLRTAVRDGYACTVEELEIGLNAAAAPIRSYDRRVVAALSVSGPSYRLTRERLDMVAPSVIAHANEVSSRLGYLH